MPNPHAKVFLHTIMGHSLCLVECLRGADECCEYVINRCRQAYLNVMSGWNLKEEKTGMVKNWHASVSQSAVISHMWSLIALFPAVMLLERLGFLTHGPGKAVFLLGLLAVGKCNLYHTKQCFKILYTGRIILESIQRFGSHWSPILGCGHAEPSCTNRRCLAEMLIRKNCTSQPQNENCTQMIHVPLIEYQTLSVVSVLYILYWSQLRISSLLLDLS